MMKKQSASNSLSTLQCNKVYIGANNMLTNGTAQHICKTSHQINWKRQMLLTVINTKGTEKSKNPCTFYLQMLLHQPVATGRSVIYK